MQLAFEVCCHEQELNERGQKLQQWQRQRQRQMLGRRQVDCVVFSVWHTTHHSGKLSKDLNYRCCCCCCLLLTLNSCGSPTAVAAARCCCSLFCFCYFTSAVCYCRSIFWLTCALFFLFVPARFVKFLSIFGVVIDIVVIVVIVFIVGGEPTSWAPRWHKRLLLLARQDNKNVRK